MKIGRFLRDSKADEPLIVTLTGARLGDSVYFHGARLDWIVALASRAGLSGQVVVVSPNATQLKADVEREGFLVDAAAAPDPASAFDLAVVEATGDWTAGLTGLRAAVRSGGRIVVLSGGPPGGVLARFRGQGATAVPEAEMVAALATAGWGRARPIQSREGLKAVEAFHL